MLNKKPCAIQFERYLINGVEKIEIFILSCNPITVEGIMSFLGKHYYAQNIAVSACAANCENKLKKNQGKCFECQSFKFFKEETEKDTLILVIDDDYVTSIGQLLIEEIPCKKIIYTKNDNVLYLKHLVDKGIDGIVYKASPKKNILMAIETVNTGAVYIDKQISILISEYQEYLNKHPLSQLTQRQLEILYTVSKGFKNHRIAYQLNISVGAVEKHKTNIKSTLDINSADELIDYAFDNRNEIKFLLELLHNSKKTNKTNIPENRNTES